MVSSWRRDTLPEAARQFKTPPDATGIFG